MKITEEQLQTFNENFKICLAQTTTTFYSMNEYLELDDFESPDENLSQDDYKKRQLNLFHIYEYQQNSSDIDHEHYSIETKYGEHVYLVETMEDVYEFITEHMHSTLKNESYFPKETEIHIDEKHFHPKPPLTTKDKHYQPVTHI